MAGKRVLGIVLAGGRGERLAPLTTDRVKSAVPFGGHYRVVDFALSNLVNGGIRRICVLTQYKSHSLNRHIITTWRLDSPLGHYVTPVPAQQWLGPHWQAGSADAIYQSLNLIHRDQPDIVMVAGADHIYRMDPGQIIDQHIAWGAGVTVAVLPVPRRQAASFGVVQTAADGHRIEEFLEKPADPPGRQGRVLASMGIYVFDSPVLEGAVSKDAADEDSRHSIGGDIMPMLMRERAAHAYDFAQNQVPGVGARDQGYWRDVGTIDSYFAGHMDLCAARPVFSLDNDRWPIQGEVLPHPPARFVPDGGRPGRAISSLVSNGAVISGGQVRSSVLGPRVRVESRSRVNRAVILHNSLVSRHAVVQDAILDKNVLVLDGAAVGVDKEHDRARGFVVSSGGITVVGKGRVVAR